MNAVNTLEERWKDYRSKAYSAGLGPEQERERRAAYLAGIVFMLGF